MQGFCYLSLTLSLTLTLFGCGGGSSSDSDSSALFDTTVTFNVNGRAPVSFDGAAPQPSNDVNQPRITSAPSVIEVNRESSVQIELAYEITSALNDFYVSQADTTGYLQFELEMVDTNAELGAVVFTVDLPNTNETRCYEFSVADINSLVSDREFICVEPIDEAGIDDERIIYFADFAASSMLSTLSLDTGEVQVIGPTSRRLTDIAFSGLTLFGITDSTLVEVNPETGESNELGAYGSSDANALVGYESLLYAADVAGQIFSIDPQTLATEMLASIPSGASSGDLVVDPSREGLFFGTAVIDGTSSDVLYQFDLNTLEVSIVGETGFSEVWGLAIFRDQIVGLTNAGEFIIIDESNGRSALVSSNDNLSSAGATVAADPSQLF